MSVARLAISISAAALAVSVWAAAPALAAAPGSAAEAIATLNAQRVANGIPGGLVEDPAKSKGCALHNAYLAAGGKVDPDHPHKEDPGDPRYTAQGDDAARTSNLGFMGVLRPSQLWRDDLNPWINAPLHAAGLMWPWAQTTWYDASHSQACMGVGGTATIEPGSFYSFPGPGKTGVPTEERVLPEWPYNPYTKVGIPMNATAGPYLVVWGGVGGVRSASVRGPGGPVEARVFENFVFVVKPLRPHTVYTVSVEWPLLDGMPSTQAFSFTTGTGPRDHFLDPAIRLTHVRRSGRDLRFTITTSNAVGFPGYYEIDFADRRGMWPTGLHAKRVKLTLRRSQTITFRLSPQAVARGFANVSVTLPQRLGPRIPVREAVVRTTVRW